MQNFGKIKNAFNGILVEGIVSKDDSSKILFKKYIKTIKESNILKTQFLVYSNLENKIKNNSTEANLFVAENIKLLEKFKVSDIIKENNKLLALSEDVVSKLDEPYDSTLTNLHESITKLIFTKRTASSVNVITENLVNVLNYIEANKVNESTKEVIELPSSMLSAIMVDKYNEKYSELSESEKEILKVLIESTDDEKEILYSKTIRECLDIIDIKLKESSLDTKDKLLRVKDKLLNDKKEINEDFHRKISKLIELKSSLNND